MRQITAPHLEPTPHPQQREIIAAVDAATGELMRRVLHHPEFQALEARCPVVLLNAHPYLVTLCP
jgi:type VI secretion system protein ImpC